MTRSVACALVLVVWVGSAALVAQTPIPQAPAPQAPADHSGHQMPPQPPADPHAGHGAESGAPPPPAVPLPDFIPPVTDRDRAAAFPDVMGHSVHDDVINYFALFDQLEWQGGGRARGLNVDARGWIGTDTTRVWFRAEGETDAGRLEGSASHVLLGRRLFRWWDVVAGLRQDIGPGPNQTWAAIGMQGLAPYWFEVEATAYVSAAGHTQVQLATEYDLLLTNRLVLQPLAEVTVAGKADPARRIGAGLSSAELSLRLRYEFRREFAPYVGLAWHRSFFGTADQAVAAGVVRRGARLAVGLRLWR